MPKPTSKKPIRTQKPAATQRKNSVRANVKTQRLNTQVKPSSAQKKQPPLDRNTLAWIKTVNEFGRLPRGSEIKSLVGQERVKAIFASNKRSVLELWEIYTQRRDELSRRLISSKEATVAYLLGFHLANIARTSDLLTRSNKRHHWNKLCSKFPVKLYDIGCGTGAMSAAFLQSAKATEVFLYDGSGPLLDSAKFLHETLGTKSVKTSRTEIENFDQKWFTSADENTVHCYLLGYVWNELHKNNPARKKLFQILTNHLKRNEPALVFIAEPALEHMSRPAMELRDMLCHAGYQALYPCPTSDHCPMLDRPKDWCYSEGDWQQPDIARWIDGKLDLDRSRHAGTMFAFATPATGLKSDAMPVVVGRPTKEAGIERYKGHFDYLVCKGDEIAKVAPKTPKTVLKRGDLFSEE